ncbi:MAG: 23S rRNA (uracil(1939)-C(5))-methyltransferase RlmD [Rhodocyclaceae bacterium]
MPQALIESLDHEGKGVARVGGKTVFVDGALPGERVEFASQRRKPTYEFAVVERILAPSPYRAVPRCRYFGTCGGCAMQHLEFHAQTAIKQRALEDALWHIARLRPEQIYAAIEGPQWAYRHRARLSVRLVPRKGCVLIGFHERRSSYVADMESCEVLPHAISRLLLPLRQLIGGLSVADRLPQVEVAVGDAVVVLVLRVLDTPDAGDEAAMREFAVRHRVMLYLQAGGPQTARPFHPEAPEPLAYSLPEFGVRIAFMPTDFTQVNHAMNEVLVRRALQLLDARAGERVLELFCGLGNFTLPIARGGAHVTAIEGNPALLGRARENAQANGLSARVRFVAGDLFALDEHVLAEFARQEKMLIDPPREGAIEVVKALADGAPRRIVYVSCNPATLARDAAVLVRQKGYRLRGAGILNMFPHTAHVESIACFDRDAQ